MSHPSVLGEDMVTRLRSAWWHLKMAVRSLSDPDQVARLVQSRARVTSFEDRDKLEALAMMARTTHYRMQCRIEACLEREGSEESAVVGAGIGISYLFAREVAHTTDRLSEMLEVALGL